MTAERKSANSLTLALRNPQFRLYTFGGLPSLLGTWVQRVAVGWLAWELTHMNIWVGAIALADMLPMVFIGPVAGAMADRLDRLSVCRFLQILAMCQALTLAAITLAGFMTVELLVVLAAVQGALSAATQPFRHAIVANLVTREELPGAIATNSIAWHGSRFVGPAIAGIVIATVGVGAAFVINGLSYVSFLYALFRIKVPPNPKSERSLTELPHEILEGARYAFTHPVIGPMLLVLFVCSVVGRAAMELLPGFSAEVLGRGEAGFASLVSAAGMGAMLGALWFGWRAKMGGLVRIVTLNVFVLCLSLLALVSSTRFEFALASLVLAGGSLLISGISIQTMVQSNVTDDLRGRVMGIYGWCWMGSPGLGAILIGAVSDYAGLRWPIFVSALFVLMAGVWIWRRQGMLASASMAYRPKTGPTRGAD